MPSQDPSIHPDEVTNHLDVNYQVDVLEFKNFEMTKILVIHDINLGLRFCDRLVLMDHGCLKAIGEEIGVSMAEERLW